MTSKERIFVSSVQKELTTERCAVRPRSATTRDPGVLGIGSQQLVLFIADRCHHGKEEAQLFPLMQANGFSGGCSRNVVVLGEYELGRRDIQGKDAARDPAVSDTIADGLPRFDFFRLFGPCPLH